MIYVSRGTLDTFYEWLQAQIPLTKGMEMFSKGMGT